MGESRIKGKRFFLNTQWERNIKILTGLGKKDEFISCKEGGVFFWRREQDPPLQI